mgnify:CR=1 FL=1
MGTKKGQRRKTARRAYKKTGPAYKGGSHGRGKSWWFVESKGYHHPKRSFRTRRFATLYRKYIEDTLSESGHKKYTYDRATKTGTYAPSTFGGWLRGRN